VRDWNYCALSLKILILLLAFAEGNPAHAFSRKKSQPSPESAAIKATSVSMIFVCYSASECPAMPEGWPAITDSNQRTYSSQSYLSEVVNPNFQSLGKAFANFQLKTAKNVVFPKYFNITGGSTGAERTTILEELRSRFAEPDSINVFVVNTISQYAAWADMNRVPREKPSIVIDSAWLYRDDQNYHVPSHEIMHVLGSDHTADFTPKFFSYSRCNNRIFWQIEDANTFLVEEQQEGQSTLHCDRNNIMSYSKVVGTDCGNPTFFTPSHAASLQKIMQCWNRDAYYPK
jgi:hypothetical protein